MTLRSICLALSCALVCALPARAVEPSFDCAAARSQAEQAICADPELAGLDRRLGVWFDKAVAALRRTRGWQEATETLRATQRGWIKGRDECWKSGDLTACLREAYETREGELVAGYLLQGPSSVRFWTCSQTPADEVVIYSFDLPRPALRLERGDTIEAMIQIPAASGARYAGSFGREIWFKGEEAELTWPEGQTRTCRRK